jgi:hypothetical protein
VLPVAVLVNVPMLFIVLIVPLSSRAALNAVAPLPKTIAVPEILLLFFFDEFCQEVNRYIFVQSVTIHEPLDGCRMLCQNTF